MYAVKMAFALVQIGTNLWINPMQVQGVRAMTVPRADCQSFVLVSAMDSAICTDWTIDQVREALRPAAVSKALEGK